MSLPSSSTIPSIAFDTCIFPGLAKGDIPQREIDAIGHIESVAQTSRVTLWTSTNVREELGKYQDLQGRQEQFAIFDQWLEKPGYPSTQPLPEKLSKSADGVYTQLCSFLGEGDARLATAAYQVNATYVVTCDLKSFRRYADKVESITSVLVRIPSEIVAELGLSPTL